MLCDGRADPPIVYRVPDATETLLKALQNEESNINVVLGKPRTMNMTPEDWKDHKTAINCHVCKKP